MALTTNIVFGSMQPHPVQWQAPMILFSDDSSVVAFRKCGPPKGWYANVVLPSVSWV